jgi:hypothetical protein
MANIWREGRITFSFILYCNMEFRFPFYLLKGCVVLVFLTHAIMFKTTFRTFRPIPPLRIWSSAVAAAAAAAAAAAVGWPVFDVRETKLDFYGWIAAGNH